ncbi:hypothetical protein SAMN02745225_01054 [Ferrithrix thermotolerans DSM 19514]|uniref:Uncharacterized protein n=1 Tax=Ferrithrix thermotolerans DSM 19514 TaxID=1121881 RepID=A0A1M4UPF4_9ACTN|nr:hypothetical protein SAMN02745225_01054 [Ferrithrix thermotolerans DSM 19514]
MAAGVSQAFLCRAQLLDAEESRPHPAEEQGHQATGQNEVWDRRRSRLRSRQPAPFEPRSHCRRPVNTTRRLRAVQPPPWSAKNGASRSRPSRKAPRGATRQRRLPFSRSKPPVPASRLRNSQPEFRKLATGSRYEQPLVVPQLEHT